MKSDRHAEFGMPVFPHSELSVQHWLGGGSRNSNGLSERWWTIEGWGTNAGACPSRPLKSKRNSGQIDAGATREKLSDNRITSRAAISATGVRLTGAAETARSAHNAVITATTARICLERDFKSLPIQLALCAATPVGQAPSWCRASGAAGALTGDVPHWGPSDSAGEGTGGTSIPAAPPADPQ
jgi:hypothetical protein